MADRYGQGSEGFEQTLARFRQQGSLRDELNRKVQEGSKVEQDAASVRNRIAAEEEAVARRELAAEEDLIRTRKAGADVIDTETAARRRAIASMTEEEALLRRHQALQQGLNETRANYSRTVAQEGIGGAQSAQLAAQEAEIRRRMGLVSQEMQFRGMPPPPVTPYLAREDPNRMRELTAGTSTIVAGPGGAERIQEGTATGRDEAIRRTNQEIQANVQARQAQAAALAREEAIETQAAAATQAINGRVATATAIEKERAVATRESAVAFSALDTSMYRHGALTSEFIQAAARGEVTIRDLGNQVLVTTAKFAGWTAAAGLVYGAYKAIKDFGTGAVETQNAVTNLSRFITTGFDTTKAREQLQSLARETNVPIKEVGDAAAQFARVFHDQDQAFEAARASIILTKLDNLSTADSYKSLTAAIQGFHLEAKDIPGLMDSINASQREFGANVSQITAGFGRAAGGVYIANQGQNPKDIAQFTQALLATIIRTTGGQGANVGIALGRAATRFSTQPANVATLAGYGIRTDQGFDNIIKSAFEQIQKRGLGGQDVVKIAQAIGGPQFGARYFAGLLENAQLFNKILADTSPERAKGTAQEELQKKLHSFSEELKSVGVNFQVLGSELEQSGAFEPVHFAVEALAEMVKLSGDVLAIFNQVPTPLRDALIAITGIVAATRVLGRFGGVSGLVSHIPGFGEIGSSDQVMQRRIVSGLRTQRSAAYGAAESYARTGVQSSIEAEAAAIRARTFGEQNAAALAGKEGLERQNAAEAEMARLEAERAAAIERYNAATARVLAAEEIAARTDAELAEMRDASAAEAVRIGRARNYPVVTGFNRPTAGGVEHMGGGAGAVDPRTGESIAPVVGGEAAAVTEDIGIQATTARQVIAREAESMRVSVGNLFTQWQAGLAAWGADGAVGGAARRGLESAETVAQRGVTAAEVAAAGAAGMATRVKALMTANVASLNGLLGLFLAYSILEGQFNDAANKMQTAINREANLGDSATRLQTASQRVSQNFNPLTFTGLFFTHPGKAGQYAANAYTQPTLESDNYILKTTIATEQANARRQGNPIPNQTAQQIESSARQQVEDYKRGRINLRQLQDDFAKHAIELKASIFITTPQQEQEIQQTLNQLAAQADTSTGKSYYSGLEKLDSKHLTALTTSTLRDLKAFGTATSAGRIAMSHLGDQLARAEEIALNTGNEGDINAFAQAQEQITGAIKTQVQSDLQVALSLASNERERQQAYRDAINASHAVLTGPDINVSHSRQALDDAQTNLATARRKLADTQKQQREIPAPHPTALQQQGGPLSRSGPFGPGADPLGDRRVDPKAEADAVKAYRDQVKNYRDRLKKAQDYRTEALREYKAEVEQLKEQAAQDYAAGLDAAAAVREAGYTSQAQVLADQIRVAGQKVAYDVQHFGRDNRITEQAIANQQQLIAQAAQQGLQDVQLLGQLSVSTLPTTDTIGRANQTAAGARRALAYVDAHKRQLGPQWWQAHVQALISVNDTAHALQDATAQDAADLAQARFTYLESLTTDPLKRDQLQIQAAQRAVADARTPADRYRALAQVNQMKQQYVADRISGRESDIQFQLDMGKITTDQAEKDLEALLKIRGITKQQKQEIQERIKQLKDTADQEASGFALQVGNINLPTVYDVRRALGSVRESIAAAKAGVTPVVANNNTTINVDVQDAAAAPKVYDAIDRAAKTSLRATMRTVGMRRG